MREKTTESIFQAISKAHKLELVSGYCDVERGSSESIFGFRRDDQEAYPFIGANSQWDACGDPSLRENKVTEYFFVIRPSFTAD